MKRGDRYCVKLINFDLTSTQTANFLSRCLMPFLVVLARLDPPPTRAALEWYSPVR
jgi:hypothetical protein